MTLVKHESMWSGRQMKSFAKMAEAEDRAEANREYGEGVVFDVEMPGHEDLMVIVTPDLVPMLSDVDVPVGSTPMICEPTAARPAMSRLIDGLAVVGFHGSQPTCRYAAGRVVTMSRLPRSTDWRLETENRG